MLSNLQLLRAFAALNVVLFHIIIIADEQGFAIPSLEFLRDWGANGVDIFFVLSGFIMVYISELRPRTPSSFLKNRTLRIVPIYWILTLLGCVAVIFAGDYRGESVTFEVIATSFLFLTRWTSTEMPILYVGWTLEWEMLFYLIFAFSLIFKSKTIQFAIPLILLTGLVLLAGQNHIILEFGLGMIVAKIYKSNIIIEHAKLLTLIGASLLMASIWIKSDLPQLIVWGLPSSLIVLGLVNIKQYKFPLGEHLGNASYSIYLIQVFTIPVFYKVAEKIFPNISTLLLAGGCLIGTALAGSLCHLFIEKPVNKFLKKYVT